MKLKEEWADTIKTNYSTKVQEIFVNPTRKELNEFKEGIRWIADSETKKVYISSINLPHSYVIYKVILKVKGRSELGGLPHFETDRWLTGSKARVYDSDMINKFKRVDSYKKQLNSIKKKNWSWAYKYLPGLDKFVEEEIKGKQLKEDTMKLNESGIRIPKGSRAAKVIFHRDLDGVMSAILTVNQLVKQGIPKDRITLSSIQYGTSDEEIDKMMSKSKGQMVALVDFARLPEGSKKPDFWSDHHQQDSEAEKSRKEREGKKQSAKGRILQKKVDREKEVAGSAELEKKLKEKFDVDTFKKLLVELEKQLAEWKTDKNNHVRQTLLHGQWDWPEFYDDLKNIGEAGKAVQSSKIFPEIKKSIIDSYRKAYKQVRDKNKTAAETKERNSKKSAKGMVGGRPKKAVNEAIGKTDFKSEAEHLSKVHAQNLMTGKDIDAISKIDSASYSNLADVIKLPTNFKAKGRMERLAILTNVLLTGILDNESALREVIKRANPSIMSVYTTLLDVKKLNNKQAAIIKEISKKSPDWAKISSERKGLPVEMSKEAVKGGRIKKSSDIAEIRASRARSVEKHTDPKTTAFKRGNEYVVVQTASGRGQPQRFMGSLLTSPSGEKYPAAMREWSTMLQISVNPDLSDEDKKKFDLPKLVDGVLSSVITDINTGKIKVGDIGLTNWAFNKVIRPEAGGHAGIATAGGLGTLGLAPKPTREELKVIKEYSKRVSALKGKKKFRDIMPKTAARQTELNRIKKKYAEERKMLVAEIKKRILNGVANEMREKGVTKPKGEEKFKVKSKIKEEIQYKTRHWIN